MLGSIPTERGKFRVRFHNHSVRMDLKGPFSQSLGANGPQGSIPTERGKFRVRFHNHSVRMDLKGSFTMQKSESNITFPLINMATEPIKAASHFNFAQYE